MAQVVIQSGGGQTRQVNSHYGGITVKVTSDGFAPIVGVPVEFNVPPSGPSMSWDGGWWYQQKITDANGEATCDGALANGTAGQFGVDITSEGANAVTYFTNTTDPTPPQDVWTVQIISGSGQIATVEQQFALPIRARLFNNFGTPSAGNQIIFELPTNIGDPPRGTFPGGSPTYVSVVTDANGYANSPMITASTKAGRWQAAVYGDFVLGPQWQAAAFENRAKATSVPLLFCEA